MAKDGLNVGFDSKDFEKGLQNYSQMAINALLAAAYLAAESLRGDSMNAAPFDKGTAGGLVSTASSTRPEVVGDDVIVKVGYNKEYAVRLHEDMTLKIKQKNTVGGQTRAQKYLENPMKENAKRYLEIYANQLKKIT